MIQPLWRTVWRFLKKLTIELPYDPAIPLLGIYPEKTIIQKEARTTMFVAAIFTIARKWKQPKCPSTDEWVDFLKGRNEKPQFLGLARKEAGQRRSWATEEQSSLLGEAELRDNPDGFPVPEPWPGLA